MIFLFLTSSRSTYLNNIFSTLHLPSGMVNRYQYNCEGNSGVVDTSIIRNCYEGDEVIISYVDKDATNEQIYYPLRKGELIHCQEADDRMYFDVKLLDYCYAVNDKGYSEFLKNIFQNRIYCKQNNSNDWKGALALKENTDINNQVKTSENAWIITVKKLSQKKSFLGYYSIFTKICIVDADKNPLEIVQKDKEYGYQLKAEQNYTIKLSYYIHEFNTAPMTELHMSVDDSRKICGIVSEDVEIGCKQDLQDIYLEIPRTDKEKRTSIKIACKESQVGTKTIVYARKTLTVFVESKVSETIRRGLIILCVIMLAISTWISALPIESILAEQPVGMVEGFMYNLSTLLNDCRYIYTVICSGVSSIATLGLIHLYGKPKL